ncbi:hypothetical protein SAMN05428949_4855 [Chitinophaga sp. YR627]|nr:hypothetical protein SAMN05428949_4855 [Chitinophaga sp. YR627]
MVRLFLCARPEKNQEIENWAEAASWSKITDCLLPGPERGLMRAVEMM